MVERENVRERQERENVREGVKGSEISLHCQ
jgi:hypothetical protein